MVLQSPHADFRITYRFLSSVVYLFFLGSSPGGFLNSFVGRFRALADETLIKKQCCWQKVDFLGVALLPPVYHSHYTPYRETLWIFVILKSKPVTSGFIKYRKCITTTNSTYTYCNRTAYIDPNYEQEDVSYTNEIGSCTVTITGLAQEVTE